MSRSAGTPRSPRSAGSTPTRSIKATGVETVGDLLGIFPRRYVRKGSLSELDELTEGDLLTLVGEVVSSQQKTYQDRRTRRTAYRLEVRVRAEDGSLLLTYFDRQKHTADWRAREVLRRCRRPVRRPAEVVQRPVAADQPRLADVRRQTSETVATMPDLIPLYSSVAAVNTWHFEDTIALALDLVEDVPDVLPAERPRGRGPARAPHQALRWIHRPDTWAQKVSAEKRLKYDEAFVAQTVLARRRLPSSAPSPTRDRAVPAGCSTPSTSGCPSR